MTGSQMWFSPNRVALLARVLLSLLILLILLLASQHTAGVHASTWLQSMV